MENFINFLYLITQYYNKTSKYNSNSTIRGVFYLYIGFINFKIEIYLHICLNVILQNF